MEGGHACGFGEVEDGCNSGCSSWVVEVHDLDILEVLEALDVQDNLEDLGGAEDSCSCNCSWEDSWMVEEEDYSNLAVECF